MPLGLFSFFPPLRALKLLLGGGERSQCQQSARWLPVLSTRSCCPVASWEADLGAEVLPKGCFSGLVTGNRSRSLFA